MAEPQRKVELSKLQTTLEDQKQFILKTAVEKGTLCRIQRDLLKLYLVSINMLLFVCNHLKLKETEVVILTAKFATAAVWLFMPQIDMERLVADRDLTYLCTVVGSQNKIIQFSTNMFFSQNLGLIFLLYL